MLKKAFAYFTEARTLYLLGLESKLEVLGYFVYAVTLVELGVYISSSSYGYELTFSGILYSFFISLIVRLLFTGLVRLYHEVF